ncbi:MAG: serine/threonine-protein phosphatase [Planctomycetes bacterium]|nr:serine/threonine-protein phosphatase [Planctomycetota bacterium]
MVDTVRELSIHTDPQALISVFRRRAFRLYGADESLSLSRRDLDRPFYRITRSSRWDEDINPWKEKDRLPLCEGGMLADVIYGDEPCILNGVNVCDDDPAYDYLKNARSLVCIPLYESGVGLNMVVRVSYRANYFDPINLADAVLESNLFGRATSGLVQAQRAEAAYAELDYEMKRVAQIQRALLPATLPDIKGVDIAVSYKTAARAGGDYYDFFDLGDGRWGILIADVSGHGAPAAVVMAITRTMLHSQCHEGTSPGKVLGGVNDQLARQAEQYDSAFVTAFYGVYDPRNKSLTYACAGHCPPLVVGRGGQVRELDKVQSLPLAVMNGTQYPESTTRLESGDTMILYTDGITEATNAAGEQYGHERLLTCVCANAPNAQSIVDCVTNKLLGYTDMAPAIDDQTLLALRVE